MSRVFISYSHEDKDWVRAWLLPRLECDGIEGHIDYRDFEIGIPCILNMERAAEECDKTILVMSPHWCESEWTQFEGLMLQTEDPTNLQKKIMPVLFYKCDLPKRLKMLTYADFTDENEWESQLARLKAQIRKDIPEVEEEKPVYSPPDKIDIIRLPQTGYELFGRQEELKLLNDAWDSEVTNLISFVAYGGTGKSTLVNKWLERMRWDNYHGAKRVFGWSFYSQGTGERVTSADLFIKEALTWFGDENPEEGSPWDKGKRLAKLIQEEKTLLILDGMEPLQSYLDVEKGRIKDPALGVLVTDLAKNNNGLCVITTREEIPELDRYLDTTQSINLEQISDEAGRALLRVRGVQGTDEELGKVTRAFGNHALAINLLAEYLHLMPEHPAKEALKIPGLKNVPVKKGKHPRRVIEAFAKHLGESAELELLHILGLFDRPAEQEAIDAVVEGEPIPGLTEHLNGLSKDGWSNVIENLRKFKLLARKSEHRPDTLDCHPLVREHFGEKLKAKSEQAWIEAHSRVYEYYKSLPEKLYGKELPDDLVEMESLLVAVAHGCKAGEYLDTLYDVYNKRIVRNKDFINSQLGAFGSDLSVLSNYFEKPWSKIVPAITDANEAAVLSWAGFALRAMGRLREAAQPMQAGMDYSIQQKDWEGAVRDACNISELFLAIGDMEQAVDYAHRSVEFADRSRDWELKIFGLPALGEALNQAGELEESERAFRELENHQKKNQPEYPYLYSLRGFRFCDLLLSQGKVREVLERTKQTLEWANQGGLSLLTRALDKLTLGRAYLLESTYKQAEDYLNQAVGGLREAGQEWFLPRGLFTRALFYRVQDEFTKAWEDLEEAREIAERGEMKLWMVDYHLEACRLCLDQCRDEACLVSTEKRESAGTTHASSESDVKTAREHAETAERLVRETGYHRRDPEVELCWSGVFLAEGDKAKAQKQLTKAKKTLDKMGIREWDWEVRRLEERLP